MKRRDFIALLGGAAAAWPLTARAQQPVRQITVWMGRGNDAEGQRHAAAFRETLRALGWVDGRNVRTHYHWVTGDIDRARLAKEVVEQKPDLITAESTVAVAALALETRTIPIRKTR
jgi:putative ABC transport system substrate-binding protein